jgi:hypothetical protein
MTSWFWRVAGQDVCDRSFYDAIGQTLLKLLFEILNKVS